MNNRIPTQKNTGKDQKANDADVPFTRRSILKRVGAAGIGSGLVGGGVGIDTTAAHETDNHLAQTPPMGWNSWNTFEENIDATLIREIADAMVDSGMKEAGYEYVTVDDYWMQEELDDDGKLQPDPERFPNGIEPVATYVHEQGLKFGLYSTAGTITCQRLAGSLGHERKHAQQFADWGVDYLKYDHCGMIDADVPDVDKITVDDGDSFSSSYEAEADANLLEGTAEIIDCDGCSGGQKVTGLDGDEQGSLTFTEVEVPEDGEYDVTIDYAYAGGIRVSYHPTAYLLVNDSAQTDRIRFNETGGWDSTESITVSVELEAGTNGIKIYNPQTDWEVKYDAFSEMRDALDAVDRDIVYSINANVGQEVTHADKSWADLTNLWRTTQDIKPCWDCGPGNWYNGVLSIVDRNEPLAPLAGPGHWNDPDMLEVGVEVEGFPGLSVEESRSHFSLWAIMAAPLNAGNDLRNMSEDTREILTNEEVIAIDQDPDGVQGRRIRDDGDREVWRKPLANGDIAVILFNRGESSQRIGVDPSELGLPERKPYRARDLWEHSEDVREDELASTVPAHGVKMYRIASPPRRIGRPGNN